MSGRYRIVRSLARGGMAEVFEALAVGHGGFERRVAIKRMLPHVEEEDGFARMFLDEARITSRLHHSNIVSVIDFGVLEATPFQVLEFVDGLDAGSLARQASRSGVPITPEVAITVCLQAALGLEYAHTVRENDVLLGIVHRDIKPANVLVSWDGDVKIADFGIAFAKMRENRTIAGETKGTPAYMAPEQRAGQTVDARTDVFALGCTLHALLSGRSPLADEASTARLLIDGRVDLDPTLPEDLRRIIAQAVQAKPEQRYAGAGAMAIALQEALAARTPKHGRLLLKDWLATVRPTTPKASPAGRLDALMNVEIEPATGGGEGDARTFRFSALPPAAAPAARTTEEPTASASMPPALSEKETRTEQATASRTGAAAARRYIALGLSILAGACVVATAAWWRRSAGNSVLTTQAPSASAPSPDLPVTPEPDGQAQAASAPSPPVALDAATPHGAAPPAVVAANPAPVHATRRSASPANPETARPAPEPAIPATLAVGSGPDERGTEVIIDGVAAGFAPKYFTLPAGPHKLTFRRADGSIRGPVHVDLTSAHTRAAPLRVTVPP